MTEDSLKKKTFTGIIWSYINRFGTQIMSIIPSMILARLLSPSEYGLIAMTAVFTGIAYQLADGGFGNALVQKKDADHIDYCSVFYFNLFICSIIYLIIYFLSPYFASFFNEERLVPIIRVSSLGVIFLAIGQVHGIIFKKIIEYKRPAIRNLSVQLISLLIAVWMAYAGYGVWALVFQGLVYTLCGSIANWLISDWRPTLVFSFNRLKILFGYGSKLLVTSIVDYCFNKGYDVVLGKWYSSDSLAYYNRANSTVGLFSGTFFGVFSGITFPVFVQMQDDSERLRMNIRKFITVSSMIILAVMLTLIVIAEPLFHFLYSSRWDTSIPYFQLICISTLLYPQISILESVLLAKGFSGLFLKLSILRKLFIVLALLITYRLGVVYMVLSVIVLKIIDVLLLTQFTKKIINYGLIDLIRDLLKYLIISILLFAFLFLVQKIISVLLSNLLLPEMLGAFINLVVISIISLSLFYFVYRFCKVEGYRQLGDFMIEVTGGHPFVARLFR